MAVRTPILLMSPSLTFSRARVVVKTLTEAGHLTYFAGGCVRDLLRGVSPKDYDLATTASVQEMQKLFSKTILTGEHFGVVRVVYEGEEFEIAQFRKESDYVGGRWPSLVEPATPEEDARRRDLTINALFYDPEKGELIDYVGGLQDLRAQMIRAVGDPRVRFQEDHLRILRTLRFRSQLGFQWVPELVPLIKEMVSLIAKVSRERVRDEYLKARRGSFFHLISRELIELGIFRVLFATLPFRIKKFHPLAAGGLILDESIWWELGLWSMLSGGSWQATVNELQGLKLSRSEIRSLQQFLSWFDEQNPWQAERLGALIERSFTVGSREGLVTWLGIHPGVYNQETLLKEALRRFSLPPEAWIKAIDLPGLSGPELGNTLKKFYFRQLEGVDRSREMALEYLSSMKVESDKKES